ncbi:MAG: alpha/beta fold hydrolase [Spirochaetota bacterium]
MPVELSYDRFDGTGDGPQLVVLHGLFGSRRNWRSVAKDLSAREDSRGRRPTVFTVDLRHHGQSPNEGPFDLEAMAADVRAFLEGPAGGGPVTLLGHSLGGKVALLAVQRAARLIERLVLVDISPFRLAESLCRELRGVLEALQELQSSPAALQNRQAAEELLGRRIAAPEVVQFLLHNLRRGGEAGQGGMHLQLGVEAIAAGFDQACRAVLPNGEPAHSAGPQEAWREVPLLTIKGGGSEYMPAEHIEALARWFRMHDTHIIKNAGHWLHVERKAEFVEIMNELLDI